MLLELGLAAFGIGTGLSAYGQYQQGQMASKMHNYNKAVSLRYARAVKEMRTYEIAKFLSETAGIPRTQKVITAAAGLEVSGTPLKVMKETTLKLAEQSKVMQTQRDIEVAQIKAGADISGMRAGISRYAGTTGAFSTILTGGGQLAFMGYQYGRA